MESKFQRLYAHVFKDVKLNNFTTNTTESKFKWLFPCEDEELKDMNSVQCSRKLAYQIAVSTPERPNISACSWDRIKISTCFWRRGSRLSMSLWIPRVVSGLIVRNSIWRLLNRRYLKFQLDDGIHSKFQLLYQYFEDGALKHLTTQTLCVVSRSRMENTSYSSL